MNASNIAKDLAWIEEHAGAATIVDRSGKTAPWHSRTGGGRHPGGFPPSTSTAARSRALGAGIPALVSRTGYRRGRLEFARRAARAGFWRRSWTPDAWRVPSPSPARDTLARGRALLYGHELDDQTRRSPRGWTRVKLDGDDFIGCEALRHEQAHGAPRRLVGLAMRGPGIARQGYPVVLEGAPVGVVTSGTMSPTTGTAIALAYVSAALASPGTMVAVEVRGRAVTAEVVPTPFYRRPRPQPAPPPETTGTVAAETATSAEPGVAASVDVPEPPVTAPPPSELAGATAAPAPTMPEPSNLDDVPDHVPGEGES